MLRKSFIDVIILYLKRISILEENFNPKNSFTIFNTRNYLYPQYLKRTKLTRGPTNHLNACMILPQRIQLKRNILILAKNDYASD